QGPAPGKVRVLVSGREIPAYVKVNRDDLFNAGLGKFATMDVPESLVESSGILFDARDIVGRVMGRTKSPGYAFTEEDFLPKGTRPGVSAGVPAGKRAVRIEVEKVEGIIGLQPGDRFDMVAAIALPKLAQQNPQNGLDGGFAALLKSQASQPKPRRTKVTVLIQNGVVVSPLETRLVPISSNSLTSGTTARTIPVQEMVIALDPEEVVSFMEAISNEETQLTCLARSGRPDDPVDSITPSKEVESVFGGSTNFPGQSLVQDRPMVVVESIVGGERKFVPVPSRSSEKE
ncbi:MAG: hypothetical protein AAF368_06485, partial [Planctomycetota bacterium]